MVDFSSIMVNNGVEEAEKKRGYWNRLNNESKNVISGKQ